MTARDADLLASVLAETEQVIAAVKPDQRDLPTPCAEFNVAQLVDHLVGWADKFAGLAQGKSSPSDPSQHRAGEDPAAEFHDSATTMINAYQDEHPATEQTPVGVVLMEFVTHGWDLATATGQPVQYPDEATEFALATGQAMLSPEFRGAGKSFGLEQEAGASANEVEKLVAFLGRRPDWSPPEP